MACPQCHSDEISPAGLCPNCGYQINTATPEPNAEKTSLPEQDHSEQIAADHTEEEPAAEKSEVPPWRQQLSQRLHEIKQKRESMVASSPERKPVSAPNPPSKPAESLSSLQERLKKMPLRKPQIPVIPLPRQRKLEPLTESAPPPASQPQSKPAGAQEIRNLIDSAVLRQAPTSAPRPEPSQTAVGEPIVPHEHEGKLILISRTLSGLVDLIVVVLCTGGFIIAADYFSGIVALDHVSLIVFSAVFLMIFFLYSMFFLSATNQTIGMMITDLRVVEAGEMRPSIGRLIGRCCMFLVSLLCAGLGLLLGLIDRESLCFHDRVSGTRVVRI